MFDNPSFIAASSIAGVRALAHLVQSRAIDDRQFRVGVYGGLLDFAFVLSHWYMVDVAAAKKGDTSLAAMGLNVLPVFYAPRIYADFQTPSFAEKIGDSAATSAILALHTANAVSNNVALINRLV